MTVTRGDSHFFIPLTPAQMRKLDERAIRIYKIPSIILMENAGRSVADIAQKYLQKNKRSKALIICGTGNNGGDGFVVARHLQNRGLKVKIVLLGSPKDLTKDASVNYKIVKKMGIPIKAVHPHLCPLPSRERDILTGTIKETDVIVDAIFGTGLSRPVTGHLARAIQEINQSRRPVIAVDIPSGLNGETGEVMGVVIRANETVALGAPKTGFYLKDGPKVCGKVTVADISMPREYFRS